jgi:hypothetical protein
MILSSGKERRSYLAITAASRGDCPVALGRSTLREVDARGATAEGANAAVAEIAARKIAAVNFMVENLYDVLTVEFVFLKFVFLVTGISRVKI